MQSLLFSAGSLKLVDKPKPEPSSGEALIRVLKAGVCNTDLEITKGYFNYEGIIGHEFVGIVEQASDSNWSGKRVVADINLACSKCKRCLNDEKHHCPKRTVLGIVNKDGAFAEYLTMPEENLILVPDEMPSLTAVFAEPVAAALEIQEQVTFYKDEEICVIGDGKLGLLIALTLDAEGHTVHLVGHHPERLERLPSFSGTYTNNAPNSTYRTVIEATGNPSGFESAISLTAPRGTLVLKSTYSNGFSFNPAMIVVNEITILGSRCGPMDKAIALLNAGTFNPACLIDFQYPLSQGKSALNQAAQKGILKVILDIGESSQ